MATFQVQLNGCAADDDLISRMGALEVEENADLPGSIQITLPVDSDGNGDLTYINEDRFQPLANVAVVATPDGKSKQCIFDGYILSSKLHLQKGTAGSTLQLWGQDVTWLMNLEEKAREWVDVRDASVAYTIFKDHNITSAAENADDDSPSHTEGGHTLMQRASDIQFLRSLARRNGKLCRVTCADVPGKWTGYFAKPSVEGDPVVTLDLSDPDQWTVDALDLSWDITRPSRVVARQTLFNDKDSKGAGVDQTDSGLKLLESRGLAAFAGTTMSVILTAPVDDANELILRAQSVLRESGWFVRCEGEADVSRLKAILRAGTVVLINGAGALNSGKYFVWSVRHVIDKQSHRMKFVLLRNAVGNTPSNPAALSGALP